MQKLIFFFAIFEIVKNVFLYFWNCTFFPILEHCVLQCIIFQGVRKEDDGFYICSALSVAGSSVTKAYLEVTAIEDQPPPIIAMGPANQTLPINTIAVLPCQASGNPKPSIRWFKDQKAITQTESSRLMVEETGTLVIDSKDDAYTML